MHKSTIYIFLILKKTNKKKIGGTLHIKNNINVHCNLEMVSLYIQIITL